MRATKAFTLAETLIVIAIIGVTAVLTIPNINKSTTEKETIARLSKAYATLDNALEAVFTEHGNFYKLLGNVENTTDRNTILRNALLKYLKTSNAKCEKGDKCISGGYENSDYYTSFILSDGIGVGFYLFSRSDVNGSSVSLIDLDNEMWGYLIVDIDTGFKGPNKPGYDLFMFYLTIKGLYPTGMHGDGYGNGFNSCLSNPSCTAWVLENKNMDYLKTDSNKKCPNGNTLGWGATDKRSCN